MIWHSRHLPRADRAGLAVSGPVDTRHALGSIMPCFVTTRGLVTTWVSYVSRAVSRLFAIDFASTHVDGSSVGVQTRAGVERGREKSEIGSMYSHRWVTCACGVLLGEYAPAARWVLGTCWVCGMGPKGPRRVRGEKPAMLG